MVLDNLIHSLKLSFNKVNNRRRMKFFNTFPNILSQYSSVQQFDTDCIDGMFPRVYKQNIADIELTMFNTDLTVPDAEFLDNVVDKFVRCITIDINEMKRFKRRNDREEIRRRLAMGAEDDYFSRMVNNTTSNDRPGRKPSLQSRLQNGNNLQICFMNDASSDTESISSDSETCPKLSSKSTSNASSRYSSMSSVATSNPYNSRPLSVNITNNNNNNNNNTTTSTTTNNSRRTLSQRPSTLSLGPPISEEQSESDFFTKQARLQIEARMALAQAKDMAHMQMEIERQKQKESPITEVIRNSMEKVGVNFPIEKRRVSRQMCTDMNIAQLQIIVNDLHTQIERLNDHLVQYLMERDELHMSQDSMLVDIEDLTRYLSAKEQTLLNEITDRKNSTELGHHQQLSSNNNSPNGTIKLNHGTPQMQSKFQRIANLVKK